MNCSCWRWIDCFIVFTIVLLFKTIAYIILTIHTKRKSLDCWCEITREREKKRQKQKRNCVQIQHRSVCPIYFEMSNKRNLHRNVYTEKLPLRGVRLLYVLYAFDACNYVASANQAYPTEIQINKISHSRAVLKRRDSLFIVWYYINIYIIRINWARGFERLLSLL